MTALNLDSFEAALKVHYTDLRVKNLVYRNNPFLAAVPKYEYFGGKNLPIPVQFGTPQGRSATFTDANNPAVQTPGEYTDYVLTRVRNYSVAAIDNETLEASVGRPNAFMEAAASEIDGALRSLTQDLAGNLYRNQFGVRGEIANIAALEITLTNPSDIVFFEVGMTLVTVPAGTPGAATTGGPMVIQTVNRDAGTFTVDVIAGATAVGDALIQLGDAANGGDPLKMSGLAGWLPGVAPGPGDNFFSVDRSRDSSRLAGQRYPRVHEPAELLGAHQVARVQGRLRRGPLQRRSRGLLRLGPRLHPERPGQRRC